MEDRELVDRLWQRDETVLDDLFRQYGGYGRAIAERLLDSPQDAEECVNDVMHVLWRQIPPDRPRELRLYLGRIIRNLAVDRYRREHAARRETGVCLLLDELSECLPDGPTVEQTADADRLKEVLRTWLEHLSPGDRALFVRRYWYGNTVAELAAGRDVKPNTLAQRLRWLRGKLKRTLQKEGVWS